MSTEAARVIVAMMVKAANNEDIAGSMQKLEALRQNAVMRTGIRNEGMIAGGRTAGGTSGGGAGALGGAAALMKLLGKGMGARGKIGLGVGGAAAGGLFGNRLGAGAGGRLASLGTTKLSPEMQAPVTPESAGAVSAALAKAASDPYLVSRMEKTAVGMSLLRAGGRMFGNTLGRPFTSRAINPATGAKGSMFNPLASRQFSPGRTAAIGGAGAATIGGGHAYNAYRAGQGSPEDIYKRNAEAYGRASQGLQGEMDGALAGGDMGKYNELNERFQKGDFVEGTNSWNPLDWRMGGLNPFSGREHGTTLQSRMMAQQKKLQGDYNTEMGKVGPQPGDSDLVTRLNERLQSPDLLPQQAQAMQKQLDAVKKRMGQTPGTQTDAAAQIRQRMEQAGMRFSPFKAPGAAATSPAGGPQPMAGGWNLGGRPRVPGYMTGAAMMPGDFRPYQQPWDFVQGGGASRSPFQMG